MPKKNLFIRICIEECVSRQHTLRIVSLYYFVCSLMVSGFGFFYMIKWNKNVSQCWYKTQIYGNFCCSLEMMRYPSHLRTPCVKDEGKKRLPVTFKTSHNSISCHKRIKNQRKHNKKPNNPFLPSCPFHSISFVSPSQALFSCH